MCRLMKSSINVVFTILQKYVNKKSMTDIQIWRVGTSLLIRVFDRLNACNVHSKKITGNVVDSIHVYLATGYRYLIQFQPHSSVYFLG